MGSETEWKFFGHRLNAMIKQGWSKFGFDPSRAVGEYLMAMFTDPDGIVREFVAKPHEPGKLCRALIGLEFDYQAEKIGLMLPWPMRRGLYQYAKPEEAKLTLWRRVIDGRREQAAEIPLLSCPPAVRQAFEKMTGI